jgi:hypothetical protein
VLEEEEEVRWLWIEKRGKGLLSRQKLIKRCGAKKNIYGWTQF